MFFYFYDNFVNDKKYELELNKAENRLIELGINGRIEKLSILKNAKEMIEDGIKKGAHTVVAVGNDKTFSKVINIAANHNVTIGFIPIGGNSKFSEILGITNSYEACNILSKRLNKKINLGKVNKNYFIGDVNILKNNEVKIECDDKFKISLKDKAAKIAIYNLGNFLEKKQGEVWQLFPSKNNYLHLVIDGQITKKIINLFGRNKKNNKSIFPSKKIKITSLEKSVQVVLDGQITLKTPVTITLKPKKISLIMGRDRKI